MGDCVGFVVGPYVFGRLDRFERRVGRGVGILLRMTGAFVLEKMLIREVLLPSCVVSASGSLKTDAIAADISNRPTATLIAAMVKFIWCSGI